MQTAVSPPPTPPELPEGRGRAGPGGTGRSAFLAGGDHRVHHRRDRVGGGRRGRPGRLARRDRGRHAPAGRLAGRRRRCCSPRSCAGRAPGTSACAARASGRRSAGRRSASSPSTCSRRSTRSSLEPGRRADRGRGPRRRREHLRPDRGRVHDHLRRAVLPRSSSSAASSTARCARGSRLAVAAVIDGLAVRPDPLRGRPRTAC